jgi:hypothetical protein
LVDRRQQRRAGGGVGKDQQMCGDSLLRPLTAAEVWPLLATAE